MVSFGRYVAIGDSSTEGLEDPDDAGGYRGWADRLAEHIARGQSDPVEYANLAIRGLKIHDIRVSQFDRALALKPDLLSIFGGVNDVIGRRCDFALLAEDLGAMFGEARAQDITVITFTMPDPAAINPLGKALRERMYALNDIIREQSERVGVLVVDFQAYPVAEDPRLWYEDRLHGNALGHERVAAALAWRLGIAGCDEGWAEPLEPDTTQRKVGQKLVGDLDWAVHHFAPWLGKGIRGIPHGLGIEAKRPIPTVVEISPHSETARQSGGD